MDKTVGTCSRCGGRVVVCEPWFSVRPQVPHCESCGATMAKPHGPTIPMNPPRVEHEDAPRHIWHRF